MITILGHLRNVAERNEMRAHEMEHRLRYNEERMDVILEYIRLHHEATEPSYQDRLEVISDYDDIKLYTLGEIECMRFMTDRQFNVLRATKKGK